MTTENKEQLNETRIFIDGTILTLDADNSTAEAVAVRNGRIEAVGTNKEVKHRIAGQSHIVDLQGQTVIPGFIEAHGHFPLSGFDAVGVNLNSPPMRITGAIDTIMFFWDPSAPAGKIQPGLPRKKWPLKGSKHADM